MELQLSAGATDTAAAQPALPTLPPHSRRYRHRRRTAGATDTAAAQPALPTPPPRSRRYRSLPAPGL
jgi:hypothetical protein